MPPSPSHLPALDRNPSPMPTQRIFNSPRRLAPQRARRHLLIRSSTYRSEKGEAGNRTSPANRETIIEIYGASKRPFEKEREDFAAEGSRCVERISGRGCRFKGRLRRSRRKGWCGVEGNIKDATECIRRLTKGNFWMWRLM